MPRKPNKNEREFATFLESQGKTWEYEPCKLDTGQENLGGQDHKTKEGWEMTETVALVITIELQAEKYDQLAQEAKRVTNGNIGVPDLIIDSLKNLFKDNTLTLAQLDYSNNPFYAE